jgi:hypothetical protein
MNSFKKISKGCFSITLTVAALTSSLLFGDEMKSQSTQASWGKNLYVVENIYDKDNRY